MKRIFVLSAVGATVLMLAVSIVGWAEGYVLKAESPLVGGGSWWTLNATGYTDKTWLTAGDFLCTDSYYDISGLEWWMATQYGATLGDIQSFDVTFYHDLPGNTGPGAARHTYNVTAYDYQYLMGVVWPSGPNGKLYKFSTDFDTWLPQTTGTKYWVSVVADVNYASGATAGQWRWAEGDPFSEWHYADRPDDGPTGWLTYADQSSDYEFDMAFNVRGTPELPPSALLSLSMLPMGIAYLRGRRRKK